ncbi:MAG TPA: iron-containing redox enzyme family protein [Kofleriaceae bacterium]
MDIQYLIDIFELESQSLDALVRGHPALQPLFTRNFSDVDSGALRQAYLHLLKVSVDYVQYTVPALRAAGLALRDGDAVDRRWSEMFLAYAADETDEDGGSGHHHWALEDMTALGAPRELLNAPTHTSGVLYGKYFVGDAARHPYAILGAKGVLEHAAVRTAKDLADGVLASGIPHAENATRFFYQHSVLDVDHVREGDLNLNRLADLDKRRQITEGAYFTTGTYRALLHHLLPA